MNRRDFLQSAVAAVVAAKSFPLEGTDQRVPNELKPEMYTIVNESALSFTLPDSDDYPVGSHIMIVNPSDDAMVVKTNDGQVIYALDGKTCSTNTQSVQPYGCASIVKHKEDEWYLWGELGDIV